MFDLHILLVPGLKVGLMADQMEDGKKTDGGARHGRASTA